jgi:hypothetical protein
VEQRRAASVLGRFAQRWLGLDVDVQPMAC